MSAAAERGEAGRSVRRAMRIQGLLKGRTLPGMSLNELAKALDETASTVLRTLQVMAAEQMVIQYPETQRWALSVMSLQIHAAHELEMSRESARISELTQRVRAGAHR